MSDESSSWSSWLSLLPPQKVLFRWGLIGLGLMVAPAVGLYIARDANRSSRMSAPNAVVGAKAAGAAAPTAKLVRNDFAGVLLPPKMATLSTRAEGRVEAVMAKIGQRVVEGEPILRFDPRQRKHDLAQAQASLKAAQASAGAASSEMQAARRRAARRNSSVNVGGQSIALVSGEEAAQAESDARTAAARAGSAGASIAEAAARVDSLKLALEETEIKAPFDGTVTAIFFEQGMTAHAGEPVTRIVGGDGLRVRFAVAEEDVSVLRDRSRARIQLENTTFYATIDQVSPEVEPASRAFIVEGPVDGGAAACGPEGCTMVAGRAVRVSLEDPRPGQPAAMPMPNVAVASPPPVAPPLPAQPVAQPPAQPAVAAPPRR